MEQIGGLTPHSRPPGAKPRKAAAKKKAFIKKFKDYDPYTLKEIKSRQGFSTDPKFIFKENREYKPTDVYFLNLAKDGGDGGKEIRPGALKRFEDLANMIRQGPRFSMITKILNEMKGMIDALKEPSGIGIEARWDVIPELEKTYDDLETLKSAMHKSKKGKKK